MNAASEAKVVICFFALFLLTCPNFIVSGHFEECLTKGDTIYVDDSNFFGPQDGSKKNPYTEIQTAIDNSTDGDVIYVCAGTYKESLTIDKSVHLVGQARWRTKIISESNFDAIVVLADGVNISYLSLKSIGDPSTAAVNITGENCTIFSCDVKCFSQTGVILNSDNNSVVDCDFSVTKNNLSTLMVWKLAVLLHSDYNLIKNCCISDFESGIFDSGNYNGIIGNTIRDSNYAIYYDDHYGGVLGRYNENLFIDCYEGIFFQGVDGGQLMNNTFKNAKTGISFTSGDNILVRGNFFKGEGSGISIGTCDNIEISDNVFDSSGLQISTNSHWYRNLVFENNTVGGKPIRVYIDELGVIVPEDTGQVFLLGCSECVIDSLSLSDVSVGIELLFSDNNSVTNNRISNCGKGIEISNSHGGDDASYNQISNNVLSNNKNAIVVAGINSVYENDIISNEAGMQFWGHNQNNNIFNNTFTENEIAINNPENADIFNNIFEDNDIAIVLDHEGNRIVDNCIVGGGFHVEEIEESVPNQLENNTINGKSLLYLYKGEDKAICEDFAQIILIDCRNISLDGLDISNVYVGINLCNSYDCVIKNCVISDTYWGIALQNSTNNTVKSCNVSQSERGVSIDSNSHYSKVIENRFLRNSVGLFVGEAKVGENFASNTNISYNNFKRNKIGLYELKCMFTNVSYNNFLNNLVSATYNVECNYWNHNYWGRPRVLPKCIFGTIGYPYIPIPWVKFDFHPSIIKN